MHIPRNAVPLLAAAALLSACTDQAPEPTGPAADLAVYGQMAADADKVKDRWIVVFNDDTRGPGTLADRMVAEHGGRLHYRYQHAVKGFAATLPPQAVEALRRNPNVKYVEADGIVEPTTIQYNAPWGLDRIDQLDLPLSGYYNYGGTGLGVTVYVVDTGIAVDHAEFEGRASVGYDAIGEAVPTDTMRGRDCHGHGTHVAGIVGARTYGIAKQARLVSVRVFDCGGNARNIYRPTGTVSSIVAGIDWVTANRQRPAVANLSLTNSAGSVTMDNAVRALIGQRVTVVTGAAHRLINGYGTVAGVDACTNYSPARVLEAITVSASTPSDTRVENKYNGAVTWTANFGPCVDLFAPGDDIPSTWLNGGTQLLGGTSQAAPHVAGFAARYLQSDSLATPATVSSYIVAWGNPVITNPGPNTTNKLMYTGSRRRAVGS